MHGTSATNDSVDTLAKWLLKNYPEVKGVGDEPELRPGIVHRLDKETSGVLLVAKNQKSFEYLKNQFKNREVKKTYVALVQGIVKNNSGKIDTPIKRFTKSRDAVTEYKIVKKFTGLPAQAGHTLLEVYPKTGRTHQIRIHLKSIGHPIVCEKIYTKKPNCPFGLTRHFLHAQSIELNLPNGTRTKLEADIPADLEQVLKKLK
jgi:23S rRNA pseudouridine1911/1915/1917 synthase